MEKPTTAYRQWVQQLKKRIRSSQVKAALKVNTELLQLYWHLGKEILEKEKTAGWGDQLIPQLSNDLLDEFPDMKGFSVTNLYYIKRWYLFYNQPVMDCQTILPQVVAESGGESSDPYNSSIVPQVVAQIPWGHNREIITKCRDVAEALFYVSATAKHNWSRNVLVQQIESGLYQRHGKAITNFEQTLPTPQSDLARELIKDPYTFDFLTLYDAYKEKDLENALTENLTRFLLELGAGFSFVGRQYPVTVGNKNYNIDLLFYHYKLHCFIVVELKGGEFIPEYAGKLNFYLNVADDLLKKPEDNASIGILICRQRNKVVTEYALRGMNRPIGVSEYQLTASLPDNLKGSLPSIEQIEEELKDVAVKERHPTAVSNIS